MPKYWGKQIFAHGRFPEVGRKQKTEREKEKKKKKNRTMVITMASYALQHHLEWRTQSCLGQKIPHNAPFNNREMIPKTVNTIAPPPKSGMSCRKHKHKMREVCNTMKWSGPGSCNGKFVLLVHINCPGIM